MEKKDPWAIPDSGSDTNENKSDSGADAFDATQWHEVTKGETLWKIAEQYYGDGSLYSKIFAFLRIGSGFEISSPLTTLPNCEESFFSFSNSFWKKSSFFLRGIYYYLSNESLFLYSSMSFSHTFAHKCKGNAL